jgi:GH35 family endo-1,4-beta-xylanase
LLLGGCSTGGDTASTLVGTTSEAVLVPTDAGVTVTTDAGASTCGYSVSTVVDTIGSKGFNAHVIVTNVSGSPSTGFTVNVGAGAAQLVSMTRGTFTVGQYGYLLSPDTSLQSSQLQPGNSFSMELKFSGAYTSVVANVLTNDGVNCDQQAPTISMASSGTLFTSNGTLTLSAQASDNVAVGQVVFTQDGTPIAALTSPPYSVSVPVTSALNGFHVYTATAYDLSNNQASQTQRVVVSIGNKFFGSETSSAADYTTFLTYFDQITPGNAGKWGSVEAVQGAFNWTDLDTAYNFAQTNHIPFKFHNLIWGSQQPSWITSLSAADQLTAINTWFAAVAARYPNIAMIDVVNEPLHTPPPYAAALGGAGTTGWDWVVTAYQLARQYFPNSELLINDYFTLALPSITQQYLSLVNLLQGQGLIDGIGEQGHFYEKSPDLTTIQTNLNSLTATGLPVYISELDLNLQNDAQQAQRMSQLFPIFWSNPSVVGVTEWGYLQGNTWEPYTYLINGDGSLRPALTWLQCYMAGGTTCAVPTYVPQPHTGSNLGITLPAVNYDAASGLLAAGNVVAYTSSGSWLAFDQVAFNSAWNSLSVTYANGGSSSVNLAVSFGGLPSSSNAVVTTVALPPTGGWGTTQTVSVPWTPVGTTQDVYFELQGGSANLKTLQFSAPATTINLVQNGTFESGASGWYGWNGGTISASSARAHSGSQSLYVTNRTQNAPAATALTSVVTAGSTYPYSLWVSIQSPDGSAQSIDVTQSATCTTASGSTTTYSRIGSASVPSGNQWTQITGAVTVPNCTLTQFQFYVEGGNPADLYVDDVQVLLTTQNLIPDGTFESGTQGSWFGWGESSLTATNTTAHSGTYSLEGVGMSNGAIARDISSFVTPGKKYTATGWVSVSALAAGSGSVNWQLVENCNGAASDGYPWLAGATVNNGQWVQVTGTVDLTSCTTIGKLYLYAGAASGNLYVDDVSLIPLP